MGSSNERRARPAARADAAGPDLRQRWLSARALRLHLAVAVLAPGCAVAGWWQATRALAGNELSWAYSVEWPLFALIAVGAWWQLIHEDPEAFRARRAAAYAEELPTSPAEGGARTRVVVSRGLRHHAARLVAGTVVEVIAGLVAVFLVPFGRPQGWLPAEGSAAYLVHAVFGGFLLLGSLVFVFRVRASARVIRAASWTGLAGVAVAGAGGLLTVDRSLIRFLGIAVMFVGAAVAFFGYLTPLLLAQSHPAPADAAVGPLGSLPNAEG
jgi:phage shock protein PspC (stress-responsive transcriptional regulator)